MIRHINHLNHYYSTYPQPLVSTAVSYIILLFITVYTITTMIGENYSIDERTLMLPNDNYQHATLTQKQNISIMWYTINKL